MLRGMHYDVLHLTNGQFLSRCLDRVRELCRGSFGQEMQKPRFGQEYHALKYTYELFVNPTTIPRQSTTGKITRRNY